MYKTVKMMEWTFYRRLIRNLNGLAQNLLPWKLNGQKKRFNIFR